MHEFSTDWEPEDLEEFMETYGGENGLEKNFVGPASGVHDGPWLMRTGWTKHFNGHDTYSLALQTQHPGPYDENDMDLIFSVVVDAGYRYFELIHDKAQTSSHSLLRWARSVSTTDCSPAPFRFVQSPATFKRYARYWTRFLCYLCRSTLPEASSQPLLILDTNQVRLRDDLIVQAENYYHGYSTSRADLQTTIHKLFLAFIKQYMPRSSFQSPIIQYLACLGIDIRKRSFRQPSTYTPILAGFVYCIRIILIYEAHSQVDTLGSADILGIFKEMQSVYLAAVSEYPFGEILNLLAYGIKCCTEVKDPMIQWTRDGESLFYCGEHLEIANIGTMMQELADSAYSIGLKYFGWQELDLVHLDLSKLHDELGNRQVGYSFLNDIRNTASLNPRKILMRFLSTTVPVSPLFTVSRNPVSGKRQSIVRPDEFEKLLQAMEIFLELLLVLTHLSCGQPPRGTELLTVLVSNTVTHQRHIFLVNGELAILTRYNKSQAVLGKEKPILRTLPPCISQLWILYLAFTKPLILFAETTFNKQVNCESNRARISPGYTAFHTLPMYTSTTPPSISNLLFHSRQKKWITDRMTRLLRYYTADYLSFDNLCVSVYRNIAISIYRKRLQHVSLMEDIEKERQTLQIAIEQAGHSRNTSRRFYATEVTEFNIMDSDIRQIFQETSQAWHQHFGLNSYSVSQSVFTPAMYARLNPPLGSKVPLRLYPLQRNRLHLSSDLVMDHSAPRYRSFTSPLRHILIERPLAFKASDYTDYSDC